MRKFYTTILLTSFVFLFNVTLYAFDLTVNITNATCDGSMDAAFTVTPVGGVAPYMYSIDGTAYQASAYFSGLQSGGSYALYATDASGATAYLNVIIPPGPMLTAIASATPTSCLYGSDGAIVITATNATAPYTFTINITPPLQSSAATPTFTHLDGGTYPIEIIDAIGCYGEVLVTVPQGDSLRGTANILSPSCSTSPDGLMQFNFTNGVEPYTLYDPAYGVVMNVYNSSTYPNNWDGDFPSGTYTWSVMDSIGCIGQLITIVPPAPPAVTHAGADGIICNSGSIQLSGTNNGTLISPSYQWLPATGLSDPNIANPVATPAETTTYTLTTANVWNNGSYCISEDQVTITVANVQIPLVQLDNHILSVTNIQSGVTYTWQLKNGTVWDDLATGTSYPVTSPGDYRVKSTQGSCEEYSTSQSAARPASSNPFGVYTYPNPTSSVFILDELKLSDGWQTAEIINAQGRRVIPVNDIRNKTTAIINVAALESGTYIVKLTGSDGKMSTMRFIKN